MQIGISLGINARLRGGAAAFTPASLFASGEQGVWYAPSPDTCFTDTAGTTPAGVGDAVALMLDKSQGAGYLGGEFTGLGTELVTNGTFDTDLSGWTISQAIWEAGEVRINSANTGEGINQDITTKAGVYYRLSFISREANADRVLTIRIDGVQIFAIPNDSTNTEHSVIFKAELTSTNVFFRTAGSGSFYDGFLDNISVRELPGNHAVQPTAAARPIRRQTAGGLWYIEFDGIDDFLSVPAITTTAGPITMVSAQSSDNGETKSLQYILDIQHGRTIFAAVSQTTGYMGVYDGSVWQEYDGNTEIENVTSAILKSTGASYRVNGVERISFTMTAPAISGNIALGSKNDGGGNYLDGNVYGVVLVAANKSAEMDDIEKYMANRSGVTL